MGTTTSSGTSSQSVPYQTTEDINAILQGMTDAAIDRGTAALPPQLRPGYQAPLPTALQPQQASTLPVPPAPQSQQQQAQPNYTVGPVRPGDPGYQPTLPGQSQPGQPGQVTPPNVDPRMWVRPVGPQPDPNMVLQPPQQPQPQPRTGERPPINSMPRLWNGGQVGPSGQTKQQFLQGRMMHESQGDPTALNYVARRDPRMYNRGYTAGGLLQDLNTTWANGVKWASADPERYPMSQDPRKYQRAMDAPWDVQWQVNSAIYDHAGESPWKERDGSFRGVPGMGEMRNQLDERTNYQGLTPAPPRNFGEWGKAPAGMGMNLPGAMPRQSDFGRIMTGLAPLLVGIASLAARAPLSVAITAYGAMAKAQQNGQEIEYQRNRTRYQDQLKEATAQQTLESQAASDAFGEYGNNNPQGLQQALAGIALKYNDPTMFRMAERGDLNGIHQLQIRRDMLNQNLVKMNKAVQDEEDQRAQSQAVAAMDRKWRQENPNASEDEAIIAHNEHIGQAGRAGTTKDTSDQELPGVRDVIGPDGKKTGQQVREGKGGGYYDPNEPGKRVQLQPGETTQPQSTRAASDDKLSEPKAYDVVDNDGKVKRTVLARDRKSGPGLEDAETGEPIQHAPDEHLVPHVAQRAGAGGLEPAKPYDVLKDGKVQRTVLARERRDQPGFIDAQTGKPIELGEGEALQPHSKPANDSLEVSKPYDIVDDKGHIVKPNVMLRERRGEAGYVHSETGDPLVLEPGQTVKQITPTTSGGGRAGAQVLRQLVGGREVLSDLQNAVRLPVGTTIGPLGTVHPGPSIRDALTGDMVRKLTDQDSQLMQASMASMERELSILMSPVYGGNWAAQQISPLIPKSGDTLGTVIFKLARLAQSADNALEAASKSPILSNEEQQYANELRSQIHEAIPWSSGDAMDFTYRGGRPRESFGAFVQRQGIPGGRSGQGGQNQGDQKGGLPPGVTVEVK